MENSINARIYKVIFSHLTLPMTANINARQKIVDDVSMYVSDVVDEYVEAHVFDSVARSIKSNIWRNVRRTVWKKIVTKPQLEAAYKTLEQL